MPGAGSRRQACVYNLQGLCTRGAACRFSHDVGAPRPLCTFHFEEGGCRWGRGCLYSHDPPPEGVATGRGGGRAGGLRSVRGWGRGRGRQPAAAAAPIAPAAGEDNESSPPPAKPTWEELTRCRVCGPAVEDTPMGLLEHLKERHSDQPELAAQLEAQRVCCDCGKQFPSFQGLHEHIVTVHYILGWESDEFQERAENCGFTRGELDDLLCQGVKPWDEDAWDVLAVLHDYDY